MGNLRGEITKAPPIYRIFGSAYEVKLAVITAAFIGGMLLPMLMAGLSTVLLYIGGLSMLCYGCWQAYQAYTFDQELKKINEE